MPLANFPCPFGTSRYAAMKTINPALLATDLADFPMRKGMRFGKAHHAVGAVVALAGRLGKGLNELTTVELKSVDVAFAADAGAVAKGTFVKTRPWF